jgi:LCP family protein required for cell wall assembly
MNINGNDRYCKMNHSYAWGGAAKLMEVISNNYKIHIDHYVSINYQSFVAAIDALGGVTVPITEQEAKYMNRTTRVKGFESGDEVLLNGERALVYARIRKLDSEVERTRRQREVISSLIKNVKASSISDIDNAIQTFLPYVTTNYKTTEILSLASQALTEGWLQYDIVSMVQPSEEVRYGVDYFQTYSGNLFVWIVDYIKAARELQLALYDQTNIEINPATHISAIALANGSVTTSSTDDYDDDSTRDYETHYYTQYESTTRKSLFGWIQNNNETQTNIFDFGGLHTETTENPYYTPDDEYEYTTSPYYEGYLPEEEDPAEGVLPETY